MSAIHSRPLRTRRWSPRCPRIASSSTPWVGLELIEDDFATTRNQDQLVRTEDLQFGRSLRAELGLAAPAWGSDQGAAMFALYGDAGRRVDEAQSLFFTGGLNGRRESDGLSDALLQGEARYYRRQRPNLLFFADARAAVAQAPDLDHQLLLGGDNGLRGYPLRYQSGTASALLTVEERYFTDWQPFHLFHVGAAAFADAGRTWGRDVAGETPLGWLSDVGIGLRIGNTRTGLGNVLHVDHRGAAVTPAGHRLRAAARRDPPQFLAAALDDPYNAYDKLST